MEMQVVNDKPSFANSNELSQCTTGRRAAAIFASVIERFNIS